MNVSSSLSSSLCAGVAAVGLLSSQATAQQQPQKPNILFIMGDDIDIMQPSIYHRALMVGETPSIDRIGNEGRDRTHRQRISPASDQGGST
jgi:hypothetical protein